MIPHKLWKFKAVNKLIQHNIQMLIPNFDLILLTLIDISFFNKSFCCEYYSLVSHFLFTYDLGKIQFDAVW